MLERFLNIKEKFSFLEQSFNISGLKYASKLKFSRFLHLTSIVRCMTIHHHPSMTCWRCVMFGLSISEVEIMIQCFNNA